MVGIIIIRELGGDERRCWSWFDCINCMVFGGYLEFKGQGTKHSIALALI